MHASWNVSKTAEASTSILAWCGKILQRMFLHECGDVYEFYGEMFFKVCVPRDHDTQTQTSCSDLSTSYSKSLLDQFRYQKGSGEARMICHKITIISVRHNRRLLPLNSLHCRLVTVNKIFIFAAGNFCLGRKPTTQHLDSISWWIQRLPYLKNILSFLITFPHLEIQWKNSRSWHRTLYKMRVDTHQDSVDCFQR